MEDLNNDQQVTAVPQPAESIPQPEAPAPESKKFQKSAIWAFVVAILGFIVVYVGPLVAIILGVIALKAISKTGNKGKKLAIAAIVLAVLSLALTILNPAPGGVVDKLSGSTSGTKQGQPSEQTADTFVTALKDQNYDAAYALFTDEAKKNASVENFEAAMKTYGDLSNAQNTYVADYTTTQTKKPFHVYVYTLNQDASSQEKRLYVIVDPSEKHVFYVNTSKSSLGDMKLVADGFVRDSGASEL